VSDTASELDLLAEIFSSKVRAAVLRFILPRAHLGFSLTDLSRRLDLPISSLQHECYKLERIGVLIARRVGNARLYRVDARCPLLAPLTVLVERATDRDARLHGAIEAVPGLEIAFLAGYTAPEGGASHRAVDGRIDTAPSLRLVIVGDVPFDELEAAVARVERALDLPAGGLDLAFFQPDDWRSRVIRAHPLAVDLLGHRRFVLVGSVDLSALSSSATATQGS
jgi:hypothetical protein